jgi:hypothetical protein
MVIVGDLDFVNIGKPDEHCRVHKVSRLVLNPSPFSIGIQENFAVKNLLNFINTDDYSFPVIFKSDKCLKREFISSLETGDHVLINSQFCTVIDDCAFDILSGEMFNLVGIAEGECKATVVSRKLDLSELVEHIEYELDHSESEKE